MSAPAEDSAPDDPRAPADPRAEARARARGATAASARRRRERLGRARERRARRVEREADLALRLRSESRRNTIALNVTVVLSLAATFALSSLFPSERERAAISLPGAFAVIAITVYAASFALLTHWTFHRLPRRDVVIAARLARARRTSPWLRWVAGRGSVSSEALGLVLLAVLAILLLLLSEPGPYRVVLLVTTIAAILCTWYSTAVTLAVEYAAADGHGDAFELRAPRRGFDEYLYVSMIVQVSGSANENVPLTSGARRLVRLQALLGHVMTSVVVALGISVVITVL
ncbi:hypothetical protein Bra3105_07105 [Brachybacterium halotolerans subsp. kimchii]|uniref:hypothetical protein n=1 Tax=Brachybacterium halotolerans TaxID=2795215 RepID=UPI001E64F3C8|nr:hypothetical protein [Brachybacterium halotolerans]UEJ84070.1 hypothetical protein Bra3105_07105 [Brachybacterium halotolerans subsp. kimchii]